MGRRERQKRARERGILRAATHLFEHRGYDATSIDEIATRAGLAVGTVYNYFPSKADLLLAILRADVSDVTEAMEALAEDTPSDPGAALRRLCDAYVELVLRHDRALWRDLLGAALANPGDAGRRLFEADAVLMAQLARALGKFQSRGVVGKRFEPGRAAVALYSLYITGFMAWVASDTADAAALRRLIHDGIEILLHGLLARDAPKRQRTGRPASPRKGAALERKKGVKQ